MKNKEPNLVRALKVYLYDQYNCPDVHEHGEESLIDDIIFALIEKNENRCPFKNYDCIGYCKFNLVSCAQGLEIDCDREHEEIWRDFIFINESEGE